MTEFLEMSTKSAPHAHRHPAKLYMRAFLSKRLRALYLFDVGAAILFFGAMTQQVELQQAGADALGELAALGYKTPSENDPVRVFPSLTADGFSGNHAGGWRPGNIYLRQQPRGELSAAVYLRHELFHEASHRSCGGRMPAWAEEAAAMHFSGELAGLDSSAWPDATELLALQSHIGQGAELNSLDRATLGRLVGNAGWPNQPCAAPAKLSQLLGEPFPSNGDSAYLLMSLSSGRILESGGDQISRSPPGSLLKIPYAAALSEANPEVLARELALSDTDRLLRRRDYFAEERYRLLLSPIKQQTLPTQLAAADQQAWRAYLGERTPAGDYALQASLPELALAMRAALLAKPDYFRGLSRNGTLPGSTLAGQHEADKKLLTQMQALAKTGTASTETGQPLVGHLMLAWPATHPVFLALFRQRGVNGATVMNKASRLLKSWQHTHPTRFATVKVSLLTATDRGSWDARAECPELSGEHGHFTICGQFQIVSSARGSRSVRRVSGILRQAREHGPAILETDVDSYVEGVLAAEAQNLSGSARQAMRAVIAWNGSHGSHRHGDSQSLCDTTHCMVFLGESADKNPLGTSRIDLELLELLDKLAIKSGLNWLPFANGGDQRWQRQVANDELRHLFAENQILEIRRERRKDGELFIRLFYSGNEEVIGCEIFRNTLKLPSCPDSITAAGDQRWEFQGMGAGHGLGLSILRAKALAEGGRTAEQILRDAYGQSR